MLQGAGQQQVPRLRKIIQEANDLAPLGMTVWWWGPTLEHLHLTGWHWPSLGQRRWFRMGSFTQQWTRMLGSDVCQFVTGRSGDATDGALVESVVHGVRHSACGV